MKKRALKRLRLLNLNDWINIRNTVLGFFLAIAIAYSFLIILSNILSNDDAVNMEYEVKNTIDGMSIIYGDSTTNVVYKDLSKNDVKEVESYLVQLKPYILARTSKVTFKRTLSFEDYCGYWHDDSKSITIFINNCGHVKSTLCHEILHSYFVNDAIAHTFIKSIDEIEEVCYE